MKKIILLALLPFFGIANLFAQCTATVNTVNVSCYGENSGSATVIPSGGLAPYSFLWATGQITQTANNLVAGTYSVTVTDADSCFITLSATIIQPAPMTVSIVNIINPVICCDGTADVSVSGGVAPYNYQWNNWFIGDHPTNLCPGYLSVTVTDANNCMVAAIAYLSDSNSFHIVVDTLNNINCENNTTGTISVHATGGSGTGYTYYWSGMGITSTLPTLHTNIPGYYCVTSTDSDSCYDQACFNLISTYNLYASVISTNANCANNGYAIASAQGVNPPYTFLWNDSLHQTNDTAVNLSAGIYFVTVTDANGCTVTGSTQIQSSCLNVIKGRVYNDLNQNCIQDSGEPGLAGRAIMASPPYNYAYTDSLGDYLLMTPSINCTISSTNYYQPYFTPTCPQTGSMIVTFSNLGDTAIADFGYYSNPNYFDLNIHPGWTSANPGFQKTYWILFSNYGPTTLNATIRFEYDSMLQYTGSTQNGVHNLSQHEIVWTYNNLAPGNYYNSSNSPKAFFTVPATASIYDSIHAYFEILPITGDAYPINNILDIYELLTGSHDPNAKSVIPKGSGTEGFILQSDSVLFYTIHFQNDGNDTAFTVVLKDTLSPYLDPASIVPGASSHPYTFDMSGQGIMTFRFNNILLPDSNVNEPASNGYVNYSIKQKSNNTIGTIIENTAYIYFDFNEAVITNTTKNTIASPLYIKEKKSGEASVTVFPNPFLDKTMFTVNSEKYMLKYSIQIFDLLGNKILTKENIYTNRFELSAEGFEQGIYFYKIYCEKQIIASGKLIIE